MAEPRGDHMYGTPIDFLGPIVGKRILLCGVGVEAVGFAMAGADVYGFDPLVTQVQAVKDLARGRGLRDRTHLPPGRPSRPRPPDDCETVGRGGAAGRRQQ